MNDMKLKMIDSFVSRTDIDTTLSKIRSLAHQTHALGVSATPKTQEISPFQSLMSIAKSSIQSVSDAQNHTDLLKNAYLSGDDKVSISEVMIASVKSKVAFEGLLAVRNKLIESYKEIMNMPI